MTKPNIGIVGAGNTSHALAAHLSYLGYRVLIYARDLSRTRNMATTKSVSAMGKIEGVFPLLGVTDDPEELCKRTDLIFVATITTAYPDIAKRLAPFLRPEHRIITFSSKLGGSLEFRAAIERNDGPSIPVIETDALFACRLQEDGRIWIRGFKDWTLYACPQVSETREFGGLMQRFFPRLSPARNLIERGLTDFGALAHAVIALANLSRIDNQDPFLYYYEGLSAKTVVLLEHMEAEFRAVAAAYGVTLLPMKELLNRYYGCETDSLLSAMRTVPNYRHSLAPNQLDHRYLQEDVACTLMPLQQLAAKAGVATPMLDATVNIAVILGGDKIREDRRDIADWGWDSWDHEEIVTWLAS